MTLTDSSTRGSARESGILRDSVVDGLIVASLIAGAAAALMAAVSDLRLYPAVWAFVLAGACLWLAPRLARMSPDRLERIALSIILGATVLRLGYVMVIDVPPQGDFRQMWEFAKRFAADSGTTRPTVAEELRALPYLVPLAFLGRGNVGLPPLFNCVVLGVTCLVAFSLARRHLGPVAATLGVILASVAPEPLLAAELLTHDIPGTLYLVVALLLLDMLDRRAGTEPWRWRLLALGALLGLVLLLLNVQRGLAPFVLAAAGLASLRPGRGNRWHRVILMVAVPVIGMVLASRAFDKAVGIDSGAILKRHRAFWLAAYANATSTGLFRSLSPLWPVYLEMNTAEIESQAVTLAVSDFADAPEARPTNYLRRLTALHRLGSQFYLYLPESTTVQSRFPSLLRRVAATLASGTSLFVLVAILGGLFRVLTRETSGTFELPLVTMGALVASLGLLGEAQPRYLFPYWFLLTPVASLLFVRARTADSASSASMARMVRAVLLLGGVLVLGLIGSVVVDRAYTLKDGRVLRLRSTAILGQASIEKRYSVVLTPAATVTSGLNLVDVFPRRGILGLFALVGDREDICTSTLRVFGAGLPDAVRLERSRPLRLQLPVDSLVVAPTSDTSNASCRLTLTSLRVLRAAP